MNWMTQFFRRREIYGDLSKEIQQHLDEKVDELVQGGMSPDKARAQARREFGNVTLLEERSREVWQSPVLENLWRDVVQDCRFAFRGLRRTPSFAIAAILTLALGIGSTTAVFSVVDRLLFRSLPYPDDQELVSVGILAPVVAENEFLMSGMYYQWKRNQIPFQSVTSWNGLAACDLAEQNPVRLSCGRVEWDFLPTFGVQPSLGRNFTPDEDRADAPAVALLSWGLWQRRYAGDKGIVGTTVPIDGQAVRIIGVLPASFELPTLNRFDILVPQALPEKARQPSSQRALRVFARLKPEVTVEQAEARLLPLFRESLELIPPMFRKEITLTVRSLRDRQVGHTERAAWLLLASVLVVLLMACANVTNLLLARAANRRREIAVRASLGAAHGRLVQQGLTESVLLGCLGGAAGWGLAYALLRVCTAIAPAGIPRLQQAELDSRILLFAIGVSVFSSILFGIVPSLKHPRPGDLTGSRSTQAQRGILRQTLVIGQVAASMVLLTLAGLLLRSLWNLQNEPLGLDANQVVTAEVVLGGHSYADPSRAQAFFEELEARIQHLPGSEAVAISDTVPPAGAMRARPLSAIEVLGRPRFEEGTGGGVGWRAVTPEYFRALRIPVIQGRAFREEDRSGNEDVIILGQALADRLFPGENPLAQHVRIGEGEQPLRVVGVVGDVKNSGIVTKPGLEYYVVRKHTPNFGLRNWMPPQALRRASFIIRSPLKLERIGSWLRAEIQEMDSVLPVKIQSLDQRVSQLTQSPRFNAVALAAFATTAVLLAAIGLFGVVAFLVSERTREIGIRMALGATASDTTRLLLFRTMLWVALGAGLGFAGSFWSRHLVDSLVFEVSDEDVSAQVLAAVVLLLVASIAAWIPARRATRVDPMVVLKHE